MDSEAEAQKGKMICLQLPKQSTVKLYAGSVFQPTGHTATHTRLEIKKE